MSTPESQHRQHNPHTWSFQRRLHAAQRYHEQTTLTVVYPHSWKTRWHPENACAVSRPLVSRRDDPNYLSRGDVSRPIITSTHINGRLLQLSAGRPRLLPFYIKTSPLLFFPLATFIDWAEKKFREASQSDLSSWVQAGLVLITFTYQSFLKEWIFSVRSSNRTAFPFSTCGRSLIQFANHMVCYGNIVHKLSVTSQCCARVSAANEGPSVDASMDGHIACGKPLWQQSTDHIT